MKKYFNGFKEVFSKPNYLFLAIFGALLFYFLNGVIFHFSQLKIFLSQYNLFTSLFLLFSPLIKTINHFSGLSLMIISLLFGSYISLALYITSKFKKIRPNGSIIGSIGIFLGLVSPGCFVGGVCGVGFASLLGLTGFFLSLPFQGLEVSALSIILLFYANFSIAKKIGKLNY